MATNGSPTQTREINITCPAGMEPHVQKVVLGEYDSPFFGFVRPRILDIGANVGSFTVWAATRWPDCTIFAYEPLKENFAYLESNVKGLPNVEIFNVAVGLAGKQRLYLGKHNSGEASLFHEGEQQDAYEEVDSILPGDLPAANIAKIDTEGAEVLILSGLESISFQAIMLEWHGEQNRREVDRLLSNYSLVGAECTGLARGIAKYLRNDLAVAIEAQAGGLSPVMPKL